MGTYIEPRPTPVGTLAWCSLINTTENLSGKQEWNCALEIPKSQCGGLLKYLDECIERFRVDYPMWPADSKKLKRPVTFASTKGEDGERIDNPNSYLFRFKRPAMRFVNGKEAERPAPQLWDSLGKHINPEDIEDIGNGTTGKVIFRPYGYNHAGNQGIGLALEGFQILELKARSAALELQPMEGGFVHNAHDDAINLNDLAHI